VHDGSSVETGGMRCGRPQMHYAEFKLYNTAEYDPVVLYMPLIGILKLLQ
jgi:hypothetical protein